MKSSKKQSAGLLMYSIENNIAKYFIVHPTGLYSKTGTTWSIPKGEIKEDENYMNTSIREFKEETGIIPIEPFIELGNVKQKAGKTVYAWAFKGNFDGNLNCTSFVDIVNKKTGKTKTIPEVDKGGMFTKEEIKQYINPAQYEFIERLENILINNKTII